MGTLSFLGRCVFLAVLLSLLIGGLTEGALTTITDTDRDETETVPNLALGKETSQSSDVHEWGQSDKAVDGNTSGTFADKSCTHTNFEDSPWWSVDLEQGTRVTDVTLYNRLDCCEKRLQDFDVILSNSPEPEDGEGTLCGHFDGTAAKGEIINIQCPVYTRGRYVIVVMPGVTDYLTLCEVEVYNKGLGPNLALGKETSQSSEFHTFGQSDKAVDGNTSGTFDDKSCTHTNFDDSPWWSVDLGQGTQVTDVVLYNRQDCCADRLADFDVIVSNSPRPEDEEGTLCGHFDGVAGDKVILQCGQLTEGSYLIVTIPGAGQPLTLCEVEVFNRG